MTVVVAAVLVDDLHGPTRVLACRRHRPDALAGRWEFPGGKVEPDEDPVAALTRELREELGIAVTAGDELPGPAGGWRIDAGLVLRAWWARTEEAPRPGETHDRCRWLPVEELTDVTWLPVDVEVCAAVEAALRR